MNDYNLTENFSFSYKYILTSERCGEEIGLFPKANLNELKEFVPPIKTIQNLPLKRFCEILSINTDDNFHSENVVLLAFRYGNEFHRKLSILILKHHKIDTHMKNGTIRDTLSNELEFLIKHNFGKKEYSQIVEALLEY